MLVGFFSRRHASLPRGHFAVWVSPSLALGTILSAVDDFIWSPEPTFAALESAVQALYKQRKNTLTLTSTVVHGTHSSPGDTPTHTVARDSPPEATLTPTAHMHTIEPEDPALFGGGRDRPTNYEHCGNLRRSNGV